MKLGQGAPEPLGVTPDSNGINVAVFSAYAEAIVLCLFDEAGEREVARLRLPERTGDVFHGHVEGVAPGARYGLRAHGPFAPEAGHRFNPNKLLVDPHARLLDRPFRLHRAMFGYPEGSDDLGYDEKDSAPFMPKAVVMAPVGAAVHGSLVPWADSILYELHVRGFTKLHPEVPDAIRGTFAGLAHPAAIEHLAKLGVTTVELLPCAAWIDERHLGPLGLANYWGYNPVALMAPEPRLAPGGWAEIRATVAALAEAGIETIVDVVLNHSGEGDALGPTLSLRGLDNASYYRLRPEARFYVDDSGCGNTLALDRPPVVRLAMDALRNWVREAGVHGFRFDLATAMGRREDGFDPRAPLFAAIAQDPELKDLKLIAEPWDIGPGGYQLGRFPAGWGEWNDCFRDDVRRFWRGDSHRLGALASRLAGSADLFGRTRPASRSVNFVTAHDGFTLADLVAHEHKHNEANGECNRDGAGDIASWNNGIEGASDDPAVRAARLRDQKALIATLLFAQGTPMLSMGAELGQSQEGNNNGYCQDNELSWLDWAAADGELLDFARAAAALRREHKLLRRERMLGEGDVSWLRPDGQAMAPADWDAAEAASLAMVLAGERRLAVLVHRGGEAQRFVLPGGPWRLLLTSEPAGEGLTLAPRSVAVAEEEAPRRAQCVSGATLARLAEAAGIQPIWWTVDGASHEVSEETKRHLLEAMRLPVGSEGQARESLEQLAEEQARRTRRRGAADPCFLPEGVRAGRRLFGVAAQLYSLRRDGDQGIGDFTTLAELADRSAAVGAAAVGVNPLHALFPQDRERASPYSPSDRRFLDPIYLDLPEAGRGRDGGLVDYSDVWARKEAALRRRFEAFVPDSDFESFVGRGGEALRTFARFCAIARLHPGDWRQWPAELRDPRSEAVRALAGREEREVRFQLFLQYLCDRQLSEAAQRARAAGMEIGLYRDLAVGAAPDGAEAWAWQDMLACGVSIGAPPDPLGPEGQVWNLPPFDPHALVAVDYAPFAELLAANMTHSGALRIDHAIGLARQFWVPEGAEGRDGAYVTYPLEDLLSEVAHASRAARCMVVGEDLGTIPEGFRETAAARDILGYRVMLLEREGQDFRPPASWPRLSLGCVTSHDLPTFAGWWRGADIAEKRALRLIDNQDAAVAIREEEKRALCDVSGCHGDEAEAAARVHGLVASGSSALVMVQADDLSFEEMAVNLPGTDRERPNWRRRVETPLVGLMDGTGAAIIAEVRRARMQ
jgi:glycogen operon protein